MATNTRTALMAQLPKRALWTLERIVVLAGALASVAAVVFLFYSFDKLSSDIKSIFAMSYLFCIIVFLVSYLMIITQSRLYRYSQAVFHMHFVNHAIRDYLAALSVGKEDVNLKVALNQILDSIAACYSILAGRTCRVTIKELTPSLDVKTVARDTISASSAAGTSQIEHPLEKNTDFKNLWYCLDGASRYFHSNNLLRDWKAHKYLNTSFNIHGDPEVLNFFGMSMVTKWRLPYKSAMVFPIRYVHDWTRWPLLPGVESRIVQDGPPDVWGFLCVDSASTGVFKLPHAAEVGGAFADALYILFTFSKARSEAPAAGAISTNR